MKKIKRNILLNPGPLTTSDTVKYAQVVPDICPREKEFGLVVEEISNDLLKIAKGNKDYVCILMAGSGTCAMESVLSSVVAPSKKILIIDNGAYGKRLSDIAYIHNLKIVDFSESWDKAPNLEKLEEILKKNKIDYLAFVHHETTTGLLNPLLGITRIAKKYNCITIVDAISSFGGIPVNIKKGQIDFLIGSANKCLQGIPGVSFIICKKKELEKTKNYPKRSLYLDLHSQYSYLLNNRQFQFTPPVQVLYAFRQAIKEYFKEGELNRQKRFRENWETLHKGLEELGFNFLIPKKKQAGLLITVIEPSHLKFNFEKMHDILYKKGFTVYPGKLDNKKKTFRLSVIGDINKKDIKRFLKCLKDTLDTMSVL